MLMQKLLSQNATDLAVVQALYLKYNNHHTDGETTVNSMSHEVYPLQLGIKYEF